MQFRCGQTRMLSPDRNIESGTFRERSSSCSWETSRRIKTWFYFYCCNTFAFPFVAAGSYWVQGKNHHCAISRPVRSPGCPRYNKDFYFAFLFISLENRVQTTITYRKMRSLLSYCRVCMQDQQQNWFCQKNFDENGGFMYLLCSFVFVSSSTRLYKI